MKELKQIDWENNSGFEIGDNVFLINGPNSVDKAVINAFSAIIFEDYNDNNILKASVYRARLDIFCTRQYFKELEHDGDLIPLYFLTKSKEEADKWAKFYPVVVSDNIWNRAIGKEEGVEDDECELGFCCSTIGEIRNYLMKCKNHRGLVGLEVIWLEDMVKSGTHEPCSFNRPNLKIIFEALGIKINDRDEIE
jgi:hypothetical protein